MKNKEMKKSKTSEVTNCNTSKMEDKTKTEVTNCNKDKTNYQ